MFSDSDDWYEANAVEVLLGAAVENGADIQICDIEEFPEEGADISGQFGTQQIKIAGTRESLEYIFPSTGEFRSGVWGKLMKKCLLNDCEWVHPKMYAEDRALIAFAAAKSMGVAFVQDKLYHYRNRDSSLSKCSLNYMFSRHNGIDEVLSILKVNGCLIPPEYRDFKSFANEEYHKLARYFQHNILSRNNHNRFELVDEYRHSGLLENKFRMTATERAKHLLIRLRYPGGFE